MGGIWSGGLCPTQVNGGGAFVRGGGALGPTLQKCNTYRNDQTERLDLGTKGCKH